MSICKLCETMQSAFLLDSRSERIAHVHFLGNITNGSTAWILQAIYSSQFNENKCKKININVE